MFLFFASVAAQFIAVEFKKMPRIRTDTVPPKNPDAVGFSIENGFTTVLHTGYNTSSIYGIHDFIEDDSKTLEPIHNLHSLEATEDGLYKIKGLETPVSRTTLISLFYSKVFEANKVTPPKVNTRFHIKDTVAVSVRDYYSAEQLSCVKQAFRNLGCTPRLIPESTCAALKLASHIAPVAEKKVYIINCRGSSVVGSLFKISASEDKKKHVELLRADNLSIMSDVEIERMVVDKVKDAIAEKSTFSQDKVVSYLPYDRVGDAYYDIGKFTASLSNALHYESNPVFNRLEERAYDINNNELEFNLVKGFNIRIDDLRSKVNNLVNVIPELSDDTTVHLLTGYNLRNIVVNGQKVTSLNSTYVLYGMWLSKDTDYTVKDSRITEANVESDLTYLHINEEIANKKEALELIATVEDKLQLLTHSTEEQKAEFLKAVQTEEDASMLIGGISLKKAMAVVNGFKKLSEQDKAAKTAAHLLEEAVANLHEAVAVLKSEKNEKIVSQVAEELSRVEEWINANVENKNYKEFDKALIDLRIAHIKAKAQLEKELAEEQAAKKGVETIPEETVKEEKEDAIPSPVEEETATEKMKDDETEPVDADKAAKQCDSCDDHSGNLNNDSEMEAEIKKMMQDQKEGNFDADAFKKMLDAFLRAQNKEANFPSSEKEDEIL